MGAARIALTIRALGWILVIASAAIVAFFRSTGVWFSVLAMACVVADRSLLWCWRLRNDRAAEHKSALRVTQ